MPEQHYLLNRYHYDPLDRLAGLTPANDAGTRLFYRRNRLATQVQDVLHYSLLQADDHLLAQRQDSQVSLLATDRTRSVLHIQKQAQAYTAYGHLSASGERVSLLGFNGERRDSLTGHYLLGNGYRAFNPVLMRFNSPDSLSPFGAGGLNAYAYCQGDPVNYRDPTGHIVGPHYRPVPQRAPMRGISRLHAELKSMAADPEIAASSRGKDALGPLNFLAADSELELLGAAKSKPSVNLPMEHNSQGLPRASERLIWMNRKGQMHRFKYYTPEDMNRFDNRQYRSHIYRNMKTYGGLFNTEFKQQREGIVQLSDAGMYISLVLGVSSAKKYPAGLRQKIMTDVLSKMIVLRKISDRLQDAPGMRLD